jgi:hypothetical protein
MSNVQFIDKGLGAILAEAGKLGGTTLAVGLVGKAANKKHPRSGETLEDIAIINEFGAGNVPERPFLRGTILKNKKKYRKFVRDRILRGALLKKRSTKKAVNDLGKEAVKDVRRMIDSKIPPPNAPSTVDAKGFDHPLIETGLLKSSIGFKVER